MRVIAGSLHVTNVTTHLKGSSEPGFPRSWLDCVGSQEDLLGPRAGVTDLRPTQVGPKAYKGQAQDLFGRQEGNH